MAFFLSLLLVSLCFLTPIFLGYCTWRVWTTMAEIKAARRRSKEIDEHLAKVFGGVQ